MPIASLNTYVAGAAMTWAELAADFTAVRTWLNAIPGSDVLDDSVRREHLVRPAIVGFPVQGLESGFQALYDLEYGTDSPWKEEDWGPLPDRITVVPDATDSGSERRWPTPIARRVVAEEQATLSVYLTGMMWVKVNLDDAAPPDYPDTANEERGGHIRLVWVNVETGEEISETETIRMVWSVPTTPEPLQILMTRDVDPGVYDVYLEYVRDGFADGRWLQLDFSNIEMTVEVL